MVRRKKSGWKARVGFRTNRWAASASLARYVNEAWFRDGEDANDQLSPAVNTTSALLLASSGDFMSGTESNWQKNKPAIMRVIFTANITPEEAETGGHIEWQYWFMTAPAAVATDWVTNARDPNDNTLFSTVTGMPHRLLKTGFVSMITQDADGGLLQMPCRIKADLKYRRGLTLHPKWNLYFMAKPVIVNDQSGTFTAGDVAFTWNVAIKARMVSGT